MAEKQGKCRGNTGQMEQKRHWLLLPQIPQLQCLLDWACAVLAPMSSDYSDPDCLLQVLPVHPARQAAALQLRRGSVISPNLWYILWRSSLVDVIKAINKSICLNLKCWGVGVRSQAGVVNAALQGHRCISARGKMCQDINLGLPQILYTASDTGYWCYSSYGRSFCQCMQAWRGVKYNISFLLVNHVCRWIEIDHFWNEEKREMVTLGIFEWSYLWCSVSPRMESRACFMWTLEYLWMQMK